MNWDAIGAVAELLGAIGVIASLIYLARQIGQSTTQMKQNTKTLELAALDSTIQHGLQVREFLFGSDTNSELWLRGCDDFENLDRNSRVRFSALAESVFYSTQAAHARVATGAINSELFETQLPLLGRLLTRPGLAAWWERNRALFGPSFVDAVEAERRRSAT